jgi:hypothetical protein
MFAQNKIPSQAGNEISEAFETLLKRFSCHPYELCIKGNAIGAIGTVFRFSIS